MPHFKTIASYRDLPLAELAKAKLESEGIYCHLLNKYHVGMNWLYSQALGGVEVQVQTGDVEKAKDILSKDESILLNNEELGFPEENESDLCVYCGSPDLELIKYSRLSAVIIMLTQLPIIFWGSRYRCKDCGKRMKIKSK